jgi:hypothetical protein
MTHKIGATYDGQVIRPDEPLQLEPYTRVQVKVIKMKSASHQQKPLPTVEYPAKPEELATLPAGLDHYLFW